MPTIDLLSSEGKAGGSVDLPASTLVGVRALFDPGYLLEVEAIAVID